NPTYNAFYCTSGCDAVRFRGALYHGAAVETLGVGNRWGDPNINTVATPPLLNINSPAGVAYRNGIVLVPAFPDYLDTPRPSFGVWDMGAYEYPDTGVLGPPTTPSDPSTTTPPPPVAAFTASIVSGDAPLLVNFTDTTTGSVTSWFWNFGDGTSSTQENPSHSYAAGGDYTVALTATGPGGNNTAPPAGYIHASRAPGPPASGPQPLSTNQTPDNGNAADGVPYEIGMKFRVARAGQITAIRYWKAPGDTGTHIGHIWSATGGLLASVTFSGETASGWQQQALTTPLAVDANTTYTVSVNIITNYVSTVSGLASSIVNGDISSVADGANGTYGSPN